MFKNLFKSTNIKLTRKRRQYLGSKLNKIPRGNKYKHSGIYK
jgi:hypothetical protein